jgi:hypothetical protein
MQQSPPICAQFRNGNQRIERQGGGLSLCAKEQRGKSKGRRSGYAQGRHGMRLESNATASTTGPQISGQRTPWCAADMFFLGGKMRVPITQKQAGVGLGVVNGRVGASVARDPTNYTYQSTSRSACMRKLRVRKLNVGVWAQFKDSKEKMSWPRKWFPRDIIQQDG